MTLPARRRRVGPRLGVVVPAHDEQDTLDACLAGIRHATAAVAGRARVCAVVVLDSCSDRSESVVRRHGVGCVRIAARAVGRARAAGAEALLGRHGGAVDWLATTDADSVVGPGWLAAQLTAHEDGWDALIGTVEVLDLSGYPPATWERYHRAYALSGPGVHDHVHGANLGVRAEAYRAVGGFAPLRTGEDVDLVARLDAAGRRVRRVREHPVRTSARAVGRAPAGFAGHLRDLHAGLLLDTVRTVPSLSPVGA